MCLTTHGKYNHIISVGWGFGAQFRTQRFWETSLSGWSSVGKNSKYLGQYSSPLSSVLEAISFV